MRKSRYFGISRGIVNAGVDEHGQARINKAEIGAGKIFGTGSKFETGAETKASVDPTFSTNWVHILELIS